DRLGEPATRVLAELGVGLNPAARLCGSMLEDEGCRGTVHLGFGSNATIGGRNRVPFHLDMVLRHADLRVDDRPVLENGHLVLPEETL
ncbi:MAG TPA: aminopeptidase, partial [Candidatus Ozemobacteraceae bacterium]|nr:aminopeptidase [Candidatus Ozemobacteraceae bacterium]